MKRLAISKEVRTASKGRLFELAFIYYLISFMGWTFEKLGRCIVYHSLSDRGFLSLPLCPIYATAVFTAYLLLGTPQRIRPFGKSIRCDGVRGACLYFLLSSLIATVIELVIGAFFGEIFGIALWNYSERHFNLFGYVCLSYSLLWGAIITLFMQSAWRGLLRVTRKIPKRILIPLCISLYFVMALDLAFNLVYLFITGHHFNFL